MGGASIFHIEGMDCSEETGLIRKKLDGAEGVISLEFNIIRGTVHVEFDADVTGETVIRDLIEETGLRVTSGDEEKSPGFWERRGILLLTGVSGLLVFTGWVVSLSADSPIWYIPFFLVGIMVGGYHIFRKGITAIMSGSADMNFLMGIAVIGAAVIGEWLEAGVVVFLFSMAQLLESFSLERARKAIEKLMDLSPELARVRRGGDEIEITPEEVDPGEVILIKPGERIPLDGEVVTGTSHVDQSPITGESKVVMKAPGHEVFAGTLNSEGYLEVRVTREASDTTLARIIHMVEEASATRAPSQNFVDRFARYYTPTVLILAALVAAVPPLLFAQPFTVWFYRALVLLVISCPCALVISTPVTIVSALTSAARNGVLIKGGVYLEGAASIRSVVFDKTGTLTTGSLSVREVIPLGENSEEDVLRIAASIETHSEHHLARAIVEAGRAKNLSPGDPGDFESIPGKGVRANLDGKYFLLGSHRFIEEENLCNIKADEIIAKHEKRAHTTVLLADRKELLGIIVISDTLRPQSISAVEELASLGVDPVVMLTGDNEGTASAIAGELGIRNYHSGLLPGEKVEKVKELLDVHGTVAVVGDGVNDAPALAVATIGVAMGSTGTDVALETSDVALMSDDLTRVPYLIRLGRKTLRVIKENITIALLTKFVFFALALSGLATLWMAVGADMGASLIVIVNGMRLLGGRSDP